MDKLSTGPVCNNLIYHLKNGGMTRLQVFYRLSEILSKYRELASFWQGQKSQIQKYR